MEQIIKPKSLGGFVQSLSGFFITKENPAGLTPKELSILTALVFLAKQRHSSTVNKVMKEQLADLTNHNLQVTTNYVNKLRKKGVIVQDKLHPLFFKDRIIIEYGETILQ